MFKNRAAQLTFVKTPKNDSPETPKTERRLTESEIEMIKDTVKTVAVFVVASAVVLKFTDAACTIAVNAFPTK